MEISGRCMGREGDHRRRPRQYRSVRPLGSGERSSWSARLNPRFLLDTHILVHWLVASRKLSREQLRVLREAVRRRERLAVSAITLLEIAVLFERGRARSDVSVATLLSRVESDPVFQIVPFTVDVASEVAALGSALRDPSDRAIVCTARIHKLRLVTSDRRIIDSNLVPVVL